MAGEERRARFDAHAGLCATVARRMFPRNGPVGRVYGPDDAAQEALVELWGAVEGGALTKRGAIRVARRGAIEGYRRVVGRHGSARYDAAAATVQGTDVLDGVIAPDQSQEQIEARDQVERVMRCCPVAWRLATWLRYGMGWTAKSAGEAVGRSESWASIYPRAALERMRA